MTALSMRDALADPNVLGNALQSPPASLWRRALDSKPVDSWATWLTFLIAAMGESLTPDEAKVFAQFTGNRAPPTGPIKEAAFIIGRRGGKDHAIAVLAAYLATCRDYPMLARGERGV